QRDHSAMAPAKNADALRIDFGMILDHPLLPGENVFVFKATVINFLPEVFSVTGAAAIFRGDDGITLFEQFASNVQFVSRFEIAVDASMDQNQKRNFFGMAFRNESVGLKKKSIAGPLSARIVRDARC